MNRREGWNSYTITEFLFQGLVYCIRSLLNNAILTKIVHGDMNVNHWECVLLIPILIQFGHQLRHQYNHQLIQLIQSISWIFFQTAYYQYQRLSFFLFSGGAISYISILDTLHHIFAGLKVDVLTWNLNQCQKSNNT